jgi:serine/threonine protein kinase
MPTSEQIIGRMFRLVRKLGSGGMGNVFAAEKMTTHELVAVKFMNRALLEDAAQRERFKREIAALSAIRHPNVVNVYSWYVPEEGDIDPPYIVMEFLEGEGLSALLKRRRKLGVGETIAIMLQLLDGLAAAHDIGVVHRDLGSSNVFLCKPRRSVVQVKLIDFGLARPFGSEDDQVTVTRDGEIFGKAAYVAPEILQGRRFDELSDIFSCGILMLRMLTGRFPYAVTGQDLLWKERYNTRNDPTEYCSPRAFDPTIPDEIDRIVARAMRKNPEERFRSARRMQAALLACETRFQTGLSSAAYEPGPAEAEDGGPRSISDETTMAEADELEEGKEAAAEATVLSTPAWKDPETGRETDGDAAASESATTIDMSTLVHDPLWDQKTTPALELGEEGDLTTKDLPAEAPADEETGPTKSATTRELPTSSESFPAVTRDHEWDRGTSRAPTVKKLSMSLFSIMALLLAVLAVAAIVLAVMKKEPGPDREAAIPLKGVIPGKRGEGVTSGKAPVPGKETPVPATVRVTIRGVPGSVDIAVDGIALQGRPPEFEVPRSEVAREVTVTAGGYETETLSFVPDRDLELSVELKKKKPKKIYKIKEHQGSLKEKVEKTLKTKYYE